MDARAFSVKKASVEIRRFSGSSAVNDDPSEVAHAFDAFSNVLAAEHFENRVNAFAARELFDRFGVIALLVVDAMLQAELAHARQLVFGGRSSIHFDAENLSDLNSGGADSASDGVNQNTGTGLVVFRRVQQTGFPVGEIGGEEVYRESSSLLGRPVLRNGPDQVAMGHGFLGESGPLCVAHHTASAGVATGEFAAGSERWLGRACVSTARGEQIGKVQATGFHFHQHLLRRGMGIGDLLQFENLGTAETSDDECFHGESLTVEIGLVEFACGIYNMDRVSDPHSLSDSLAAGTRVAPVLQARFEGADGNARASRVGKETLAGFCPPASFPALGT